MAGARVLVLELKHFIIEPKKSVIHLADFLQRIRGQWGRWVQCTVQWLFKFIFRSVGGGGGGQLSAFFYEPRALEKISSNPPIQKKKKKRKKVSANENHTRGGGEGIGGRGGWSSVMDDRGKGAEMSASLYILALPWPQMPRRRAASARLPSAFLVKAARLKDRCKDRTWKKKKHLRASVVQLCQYLYSWWINEPQHTQRVPSSVCDVFMCHIVTEPKTEMDRISASDLLLKAGTSLSSVHTGTYKVMQYPSNTSIYSHNISECVCQVRSVGRVMKRCVRSCIISCYFHLWGGSSFKDTRRYCSPV